MTEDDDDDDEDDISPSTGIVQSPAASAPQAVQAAAANTVEESPAAADYPGKPFHKFFTIKKIKKNKKRNPKLCLK